MTLEWLEVVALLTALVEAVAACIWLSAGMAENRAATANARLAAVRLDAAVAGKFEGGGGGGADDGDLLAGRALIGAARPSCGRL